MSPCKTAPQSIAPAGSERRFAAGTTIPRATTTAVALLVVLLLAFAGCGGDGSTAATETTIDTSATGQSDTTAAEAGDDGTTDSTGESADSSEAGGDDTGGSSPAVDPAALLTDDEAAEYFGEPARHEGPTPLGAFTNVEYYPAAGMGQTLVVTVLEIGTLDLFENQVKAEAEALGETPEKIEGLGESAYFSVGTLKFFKNGVWYQITGTDPKDGRDLKTGLLSLAEKMASRAP